LLNYIMEEILDNPASIRGIVYLITNTTSDKKYVGQTLTHRKNHGRYRPFGAEGRFRDHLSEAINNTKVNQCTYLNNAIRAYGGAAFTVSVLEVCDRNILDDRERYHIAALNTLFPNGYNLTAGGRSARQSAAICNDMPLKQVRKRGGCAFRSAETRQKMSLRGKEAYADPLTRAKRAADAKAQHLQAKAARFTGLVIDPTRMEDYIQIRKGRIVVDVSGTTASFTSKYESENVLRQRAREFLTKLMPATLPNCSGNP
jgi:hypothetical protein